MNQPLEKQDKTFADTATPHTRVGIFWYVDDTVIGDTVELEDAEEYGDAFQQGGHHESWVRLTPVTGAKKKLKSHAYDYYPRGRMVFFPHGRTARLYVDECMNIASIAAVLKFFGHAHYRIEIKTDEHYRCSTCNKRFIE